MEEDIYILVTNNALYPEYIKKPYKSIKEKQPKRKMGKRFNRFLMKKKMIYK